MESAYQKNPSDIILQNLIDAVVILDEEGFIMYVNKAAEVLFGKPYETLIGENFGYPITSYEIQHIQIARNKKWLTLEMIGTTIKWEDKQAFLMSLRDVTEKTKLEDDLQEVNKQLKQKTKSLKELNDSLLQSNQALERFAHVASHDLKEPLRKIMVFSDRIRYDCQTHLPDVCKVYLYKIEHASKRMVMMIDGVLTYSSINASEEAVEKVDLNKVVADIEVDLELAIDQKKAVISYHSLCQFEGAPVLIHQLFYNLIQNSLKFSKKEVHPVIEISCLKFHRQSREYVKVNLKDNGIGFDQKNAGRIFDSFARLHSKDKYEGTGLGLSLCKEIVRRHHGRIQAKGDKNHGAEFEIILPVEQLDKIL